MRKLNNINSISLRWTLDLTYIRNRTQHTHYTHTHMKMNIIRSSLNQIECFLVSCLFYFYFCLFFSVCLVNDLCEMFSHLFRENFALFVGRYQSPAIVEYLNRTMSRCKFVDNIVYALLMNSTIYINSYHT